MSVGNVYRGLLARSSQIEDAVGSIAGKGACLGWDSCEDWTAQRTSDLVDSMLRRAADPRNKLLTYAGAKALWAGGSIYEFANQAMRGT